MEIIPEYRAKVHRDEKQEYKKFEGSFQKVQHLNNWGFRESKRMQENEVMRGRKSLIKQFKIIPQD